MVRFVIRNYGPTRQVQYKDQQVIIANDKVIETDDMELVAILQNYKAIHVTDRCPETPGPSLPPVSLIEDEPEVVDELVQTAEEIEAAGIAEEIAYSDMKLPELQALGKDRQIKVSGLKKAELIKALEVYDKQEVSEEVKVNEEVEVPA